MKSLMLTKAAFTVCAQKYSKKLNTNLWNSGTIQDIIPVFSVIWSFFLIEINAFIQQICIKLIKNSKNIYNVTKDSISNKCFWTFCS